MQTWSCYVTPNDANSTKDSDFRANLWTKMLNWVRSVWGRLPVYVYLGFGIRQLLLTRSVVILSVIARPDVAHPLLALCSPLYLRVMKLYPRRRILIPRRSRGKCPRLDLGNPLQHLWHRAWWENPPRYLASLTPDR